MEPWDFFGTQFSNFFPIVWDFHFSSTFGGPKQALIFFWFYFWTPKNKTFYLTIFLFFCLAKIRQQLDKHLEGGDNNKKTGENSFFLFCKKYRFWKAPSQKADTEWSSNVTFWVYLFSNWVFFFFSSSCSFTYVEKEYLLHCGMCKKQSNFWKSCKNESIVGQILVFITMVHADSQWEIGMARNP